MPPTQDPLRHTPGSTTPKTGPIPPATVAGQAALLGGTPQLDDHYGKPAFRSSTKVVTAQDRRAARKARLAEES